MNKPASDIQAERQVTLSRPAIVAIIACAILFGIIQVFSVTTAELIKDGFEAVGLNWIPIPKTVRHALFAVLLGCSLSWSAAYLMADFR